MKDTRTDTKCIQGRILKGYWVDGYMDGYWVDGYNDGSGYKAYTGARIVSYPARVIITT